jgi:hypothetical protein
MLNPLCPIEYREGPEMEKHDRTRPMGADRTQPVFGQYNFVHTRRRHLHRTLTHSVRSEPTYKLQTRRWLILATHCNDELTERFLSVRCARLQRPVAEKQ